MNFKTVTLKNLAKYMKTHKGIERIQKGIAAAAKPEP